MKPATILVVEDNPITRKMFRLALQSAGFAVVEAGSGREALEVAEREKPSLVLQDLLVPDGDGFDLVGRFRALPATAEVPILAVSGFLPRMEEARAVGFDDFVTKPVDPSRLIEIVRAHLPAAPVEEERPGRNRRILAADDDPLQLKLLAIRLRQLGFEVVTARDG